MTRPRSQTLPRQTPPIVVWRAARAIALPQIGQRIRRHRIRHGLTVEQTTAAYGTSRRSYGEWELGRRMCPLWRLPDLAAAIGIPVAQLFTDDLVLAEVRVSPETLERVKREGEPAANEAAARIAAGLAARLLAEASMPPVDVSHGARPKRRRKRTQVLSEGILAAQQGKALNAELRRQAREIE